MNIIYLSPFVLSCFILCACAPVDAEKVTTKAWEIISLSEQEKMEEKNTITRDMHQELSETQDMSMSPIQNLPNLTGKWALVHRVQSQTELPVLKNVTTTTITAYLLYEIEQEENRLKINQKICKIEMYTNSDFGKTELPLSFLNALPPSQREGIITSQEGSLFLEINKHHDLRGLKNDYPLDKALPTEATDENVIDQDQDQKPGMTVLLTGFPSGEVYIVQRTWDILSAQLNPMQLDKIEGNVEWGEEKNILDASDDLLKTPSVQWIHPDENRRKFALYRLNDQDQCEQVILQNAPYDIDPNELPTMP